MPYWVKVTFERNKYLVDLDQVSAFACAPNGKITFWLPDGNFPIIINRQSSLEDYQEILDYLKAVVTKSLTGSWCKIYYDRNQYLIDLDRLASFSYSYNEKLTFWLPNSSIPIILTKQSDPDNYEKILNFITKKTGHSFPED